MKLVLYNIPVVMGASCSDIYREAERASRYGDLIIENLQWSSCEEARVAERKEADDQYAEARRLMEELSRKCPGWESS